MENCCIYSFYNSFLPVFVYSISNFIRENNSWSQLCFSPLLTEMSGKTPMSQVTRPRQTMEMTWAASRRSAMITLLSGSAAGTTLTTAPNSALKWRR